MNERYFRFMIKVFLLHEWTRIKCSIVKKKTIENQMKKVKDELDHKI